MMFIALPSSELPKCILSSNSMTLLQGLGFRVQGMEKHAY
jgi:hypothetical protein